MRILMMGAVAAGLMMSGCTAKNETAAAPVKSHVPKVKIGDLTPAIIHSDPSLSGPTLSKPKMSPDGKMVTVLQGRADDANQQDLWAYDLETGKGRVLVSSTDLLGAPEVLSAEEKNRRERAREYGSGIVAYSWDSKSEQILFPLGGDVFLYNLKDGKATQVTNTEGFETDARISDSGTVVTYVRDNDLYMTTLSTGRERRLSYGANDLVRNATASFVVQEELARSTGYWLSTKEDYIAYSQIDESPVAVEHRIEYSAGGIENVAQRYPFAGTDNVTVKLGIVPTEGGETVWADIGNDEDIYLARVYWSLDGQHVYAGILSRDQKTLKMLDIDPKTGTSRLMFEETSKTWINMRGSFEALEDGGFLWSSERDGFHHIYRYGPGGTKPVQITKGAWPIKKVSCINEETSKIYFTGWQDSALEQHIFSVNFDGENMTKLSEGAGHHTASFSENCASYIGTFSNKSTPPGIRAFDNTGKPLLWLNENKLDAAHAYAPYLASHIEPEFGQLAATDGSMMDYMLYKPTDMKPGEKRPAVTVVYGGPGVQRVSKEWNNKIFLAQMLADNGFVVFQMDNRGTKNKGKVFEDHLYRSMGNSEVVDQTIGAEFLKSLDYVDAERMGVYGWSYGGYMTLHMLAQTDLYKSGVSGAPVTDWALYDTAYTERFLGDPRVGNINYTKGAYEDGAIFPHLDGLTEPFLLIHGMADDNVVFRHSIKLMGEMQARGRHNMRVMTYPGEKHGFRSKANKTHRDQQILGFFLETLAE